MGCKKKERGSFSDFVRGISRAVALETTENRRTGVQFCDKIALQNTNKCSDFFQKMAEVPCKNRSPWHNKSGQRTKRAFEEVSGLKDYAKIVLYAYPLLKTVGKDYEEHVRNKAVLSYRGTRTAEKLAEELAGEILEMHRLEWLKAKVDEVLERLTELERQLLSMRFFGKKLSLQTLGGEGRAWTERTYFRKQKRLEGKVASLLSIVGVGEEVFAKEFASIELLRKVGAKVRRYSSSS